MTTKEILMVYGEESKCIKPSAGDADLWIKFWEGPHGLAERNILVEVEHVKAHRTKKRKICRSLRSLSPKAMRRLMNWQKDEHLDEGFMVEARVKTLQQEREEVYAALQYAASFHCLVEQWKGCEELKPKPK